MKPVNLAKRLWSNISRRIALKRDFNYGKVYGSYGLSDEVELAVDVVNVINNSKPIILDVGANKGDYTALLAARLDKSSVIHCFEPSAAHQESLRGLQNQYTGRILYHPYGLSSNEGSKVLNKDRESSGLVSFYDRDITHYGITLNQKEFVETTTLDHWHKSSGIDRIAFLKVDVEGHELEVFRGGTCAFIRFSGFISVLDYA